MKKLLLLFAFILPATAQSHQFFDDAGRPVSHGTLTLMRLGYRRTVKLDEHGSASARLDPRESYIALKDRKGHFVASYSIIWTSPGKYRISSLSCAGWACAPDQTTNLFPVRQP